MRTFIAIELGAALTKRLEEELARLRKLAPETRWVKPDSLHLTLSFLGEMADAGVPAVGDAIARVASRHKPHTLRAQGSGTFGPFASPKVLWVALSGDLPALSALQADLAAELSALGYKPDFEQFEPHLTLARAKHPRGDEGLARCAAAMSDASFGELRVSEVVLFHSLSGPDGMQYQAVARYPL
jgi:2'-5' RNA ligase